MIFTKRNKENAPPKSIRTRLISNFIIVILISVLVFEAMLMYFTRFYFYNNVESILTNQIRTTADFYTQYYSNVPLDINIVDNAEIFWKQTKAEVQIVKFSGEVILDSEGIIHKDLLKSDDFKDALKNKKGVWKGIRESSGERIMAVSYQLKSDTGAVGVLRFVTSLDEIDSIIMYISLIFICIGVFVILIAVIMSILLAHSIVQPLKSVMGAAELMASGDLKVRVHKDRNDEIGKLADTLNYMAKEILNRDNVKNDFISMVSHELRTPLTSIKGWADTIIDDGFNDKEILNDGMNIITKECGRLAKMVEDLLDFSRFISGKDELKKERTDISAIVDYVKKQMSKRAAKEKISFSAVYDNLPAIFLDRDKIKQVLINLIGNSLQFTQPGGKVLLRVFEEKNSLVFQVEDNGCGISDEELPMVREKFFKGKNSKSQTGLGLAICDEIIRMHNGSLSIKSELNEGTVVEVRLPYDRGEYETKI
ncbi:signal transduction histidine kinase [Ruminiclostridium sufflavum DSM 19573]|uniref:histidine kinase n=1 Tax=Ruminiclostridium sufflavum DSM 19573 TaxID=1121337 RepID=A0A318XKI3_9FIRM|nr:HAMP domain-containing sensor histidine kinase [Ruminiclostridium sufflavum]PYG85907.1 signal transduction histidine kinase [Ruminiclostridium sufflavum DSM 19573]